MAGVVKRGFALFAMNRCCGCRCLRVSRAGDAARPDSIYRLVDPGAVYALVHTRCTAGGTGTGRPGLPSNAMPTPPAAREFRTGYTTCATCSRAPRLGCFKAFSDADKLLPIMVISTLLLGGVVVIKILAQLLKVGGAALPGCSRAASGRRCGSPP